jgi:hypothetical protein
VRPQDRRQVLVSGAGEVLTAHALRGVALQVGLEHRRPTGLALSVRAVAEPLERPVDTVEDGCGPAQLGFVALFHERAG